METFYFKTENPHANNAVTMGEYLENHLPDECIIDLQDGSYAEITTEDGERYEVHASGNGDSRNHKIEFVLIEN